MHRGLLLSSDLKSSRYPWAPSLASKTIQAPALSDAVWQFVPWLGLARRELASGRIPLWNPHQDGGVPLLGNAQSALASPFQWPILLAGVSAAWNLSLLLRLLVAAAAAFAFLRDLGRSRAAAGLGAVVFSLSGAFVAWLQYPLTLCAAPAPLLFLFARRAAREPSRRAIAAVAAATFLVLSGGHPELQVQIALLAVGVVWAAGSGGRRWSAPAAGAVLGAGLAAPVLLPFAEYFRMSAARLGEGRHPFVLSGRDLWRFVRPDLPGSNVIEAAATVSVVLLVLVPVGLWVGRHDRETRFWALAALGMLLATYDNPLARALALSTPIFWTRYLLLLPLALSAVGSAGWDWIAEGLTRRVGPRVSVAAGCALVAVAGLELLGASAGVNAASPASLLSAGTPLLARLAADPEVFRVLPLHTFLSPNSATDYGLDDVRGYDALAPAGWRRERARMGRFLDVPTQRDALEPWELAEGGEALDEWNVKYLLQAPQFDFGAEAFRNRKGLDLEEIYSGPDGRIFRNRRVKPRVRWEGLGTAQVRERRPGRWRIEVRAEGPGRLLVADPFFPGWKARVDGLGAALGERPGEPLRVDVPAGRHTVEFAYEPASFLAGAGIGLLSLVVLGVLCRRPGASA